MKGLNQRVECPVCRRWAGTDYMIRALSLPVTLPVIEASIAKGLGRGKGFEHTPVGVPPEAQRDMLVRLRDRLEEALTVVEDQL